MSEIKVWPAAIKRGTTPLLTITVYNEAMQDDTLYITIKSGNLLLTKSNYEDTDQSIMPQAIFNDDNEQIGTEINVQFSQEETLRMTPGIAVIEVGWITDENVAAKTYLGRLKIEESLYKGVMRYGRKDNT